MYCHPSERNVIEASTYYQIIEFSLQTCFLYSNLPPNNINLAQTSRVRSCGGVVVERQLPLPVKSLKETIKVFSIASLFFRSLTFTLLLSKTSKSL